MKSNIKTTKDKRKDIKNNKYTILDKIRSVYFLQKLYDNMLINKKLQIVKYNKKTQYKLNLSVKDYKEYSETFTPIEIEIMLAEDEFGRFININRNENIYFHIYFNDNKKEIKNIYKIRKEDKVTKIRIIIDYQVKSFEYLFSYCRCIKSINFRKFYRNNINDMSGMFNECSSLKELLLTNFNTNKVINMSWMFSYCSSIKELNLSNFDINNVIDMFSLVIRLLVSADPRA